MDIVSPHIRATNPFLFKYRCNIYFESYLKRHIFSFFSFLSRLTSNFFFFFVQRDDVRNFEDRKIEISCEMETSYNR